MTQPNGIINVLKPPFMTSSDAVSRVRGILGEKRVGHLGTLDPLASGVLPIAVGKSTRLFDVFLTKDKTYRAFFDFSLTTDTLDSDGVVTATSNKTVTLEDINSILGKFIGDVEQVPPMYSAKCVDGKRAYELARKNIEVELKPSKISIYNITNVAQYDNNAFSMDIHCSSGTYIRSIVRDMATELGTYGYMSALIRLNSGIFDIEHAVTFEELEQLQNEGITSPEQSLSFLQSIVLTDDDRIRKLQNGIKQNVNEKDGDYKLYFKETFCGLAKVIDGRLAITLNFLT